MTRPRICGTLLPRKRRQRGQCDRRGKRAGVGKIPDRTGIEERPETVETRAEAGHFEGRHRARQAERRRGPHRGERQSRYMIARIIPNKTAEETLAAMFAIFGEIPEELRKTLTLDNGTEFVQAHGTAPNSITTILRSPLPLPGNADPTKTSTVTYAGSSRRAQTSTR